MSAEEFQQKLKISRSEEILRVSAIRRRDLNDQLKNAKQRKVLIAVDGSDNSRHAFDCKY